MRFTVPGIAPRALRMLSTCSAVELHPQSSMWFVITAVPSIQREPRSFFFPDSVIIELHKGRDREPENWRNFQYITCQWIEDISLFISVIMFSTLEFIFICVWCSLLFYCSDKAPWKSPLLEGRVYLGLKWQRDKSPSRQEMVAADGRYCGWKWELTFQILSRKQREQVEMSWIFWKLRVYLQ